MIKKILLLIALIAVAGGGYVYFQSQQKPADVYVATETVVPSTGRNSIEKAVSLTNGVFNVQPESVLGWKATKPGGQHTGSVAISKGTLSIESGMVTGGLFDIDMTSIKLLDIQDPKFEGEIRDDFFEAKTHQKSSFVIKKTESQGTGILVYGDLTIKGVTKNITFPAKLTTNDNKAQFTASFAINRLVRGLKMWEGKVNNYLEFNFDIILTK